MKKVKVTRSFQVTIPREVREALGIRVGDYLRVYLDDKGRIIRKRSVRAGEPSGLEGC